METTRDDAAQRRSRSVDRQYSEDNPASEYGFPVAVNQFASLQSAEEQSQSPRAVGLVDPRTTRHLRRAASRTVNREVGRTGDCSLPIQIDRDAQGSGTCVDPSVSDEIRSQFFSHSLSVRPSDILNQSVGPVPVQY